GASALPKVTGGFNTHIDFKGFYVDALFTFATGYKVYDYWSQITSEPTATALYAYNANSELLDRWQKPGDITDVPKVSLSGERDVNNNYTNVSTRFLFDGDYLRLRQITFGYNL